MYLLGYDLGSSSIKAALVKADTGKTVAVAQHPAIEMDMIAHQPGWAEQDPEIWWKNCCLVTQKILSQIDIPIAQIQSIGIAYQMHGLVLIDKNQKVLRPAIIWCDSRAVEIGNQAFQDLGEEKCLSHLLNSPGNFTASKLKWVQENESDLYRQIDKILLPGDYLAMKLTGKAVTTISGLSEGMFWDFKENKIADFLLDYYKIDKELIPEIKDTFSEQGRLHSAAATATGLAADTPVTYRAGDQPNNAFSLGVVNPNEIAATGGTSGVIYGIVDRPAYDPKSRINGFAHVNHHPQTPRLGLMLCLNGAGIQYAWLKKQMADPGISYLEMEKMTEPIAVGSDGLRILPFGNGAERMLTNQSPGAQINNLQFNRHTQAHFFRAALEGIAFSFVYGFKILKKSGLAPTVIKVGNDNLFQSKIFSETLANLLNCKIEVVKTNGAAGAAKGSGIGSGFYKNFAEAVSKNEIEKVYHPDPEATDDYLKAYQLWEEDLGKMIGQGGAG